MNAVGHYPERFGPFILLRELGAGGMGSAFLALHDDTDALLVVKRMHPELVRDETIFKRFVHEAEVAAHVKHPNVAALIAMGTIDGEPFLATEFVFGIQVSQIIDRVEESLVDPIPLPVALFMSLELLAGVDAIHEACHQETGAPLGLIHRDVGARNVLVGFDGKIRLIDLGLGKSILSDWQTAHQVLAGSPDYMPPEQAMGARVDKRADIYGAAVTIWEIIAGRKRIREDSIAARLTRAVGAQPEPLLPFRPDATKRLESILKQGMATDPERRIPAAALMARPLEEEFRSSGGRTTRKDVVAWLDTACATVIAKDRRLIEDARIGARNLGQPRRPPKTQMFVQAKHGPMSTPNAYRFYQSDGAAPAPSDSPIGGFGASETLGALAALADPHNLMRAPLWVKITGAMGIFLFIALITTVTVAVMTPDQDHVTAHQLRRPPPAQTTPEVSLGEDIPLVAPPPIKPEVQEEPQPVKPPPVEPPPVVRSPPPDTTTTRISSTVRKRKKVLVGRIRTLRRQKFDIVWQKRLTQLSSRVTKARSSRALDDVERALAKIERE